MPQDAALLDILGTWAPDGATRRQILMDNPVRLYDFPPIRSNSMSEAPSVESVRN
jgi:hypothetical protein